MTTVYGEKIKVGSLHERVNQTYQIQCENHFPEMENRKLPQLSKGEFNQISIDIALQSGRDWLLFDEPLDGLDEVNRDKVMHQLQEALLANRNILLVTHEVESVEALMEYSIFLHQSQVYLAKCEDLRNQYGSVKEAYLKWREGQL